MMSNPVVIASRVELLRSIALLAPAPRSMLEVMAANAAEREYAAGEWVFQEGSPSDSLYVVIRGQVDIIKLGENGHVPLAHLASGQPLGEMGLIEDLPRSASARVAEAGAVLLELKKEQVIEPLHQQPEVLHEAVKLYGERLRANNAELQRKYVELAAANRRLECSYNGTLLALTNALDLRDRATEGHSQRVTAYSWVMGRALGFSLASLETLRLGALLHDIGKIGVSDTILHKPGRLTDDEWRVMRFHPEWGKLLVQDIEFLAGAAAVIYGHHERWDGTGYPQGLRGEAIPLDARVFSVADVFDALTMERPYKQPWTPEAARDEIVRCAGTHFDPRIIETFQGVFPSMVEVIQASKQGRLTAHFSALRNTRFQ